MNNTAENRPNFFVKWLRLTGEVDKFVKLSCQIFSGFNVPKVIKIGYSLTELFKKIKMRTFCGTQCIPCLLYTSPSPRD